MVCWAVPEGCRWKQVVQFSKNLTLPVDRQRSSRRLGWQIGREGRGKRSKVSFRLGHAPGRPATCVAFVVHVQCRRIWRLVMKKPQALSASRANLELPAPLRSARRTWRTRSPYCVRQALVKLCTPQWLRRSAKRERIETTKKSCKLTGCCLRRYIRVMSLLLLNVYGFLVTSMHSLVWVRATSTNRNSSTISW